MDQRARLQPPADMRDRITFGILEGLHVVAQQRGIHAALDTGGVTAFHRQHDRLGHIVLLRQQDVAAIDHDGALRATVVREGQREAARPVVPAARLVDVAVFGGRPEIAERADQRGAGRRADAHLARGRDLRGGGQHARAVALGGHQARQHLGRLDGQQDLGAGLQDVVLLRGEQQGHQVEHQVAGLQGRDRGAVAGQRRGAEIGQRIAAEGLLAVYGRQVQAVHDGAHLLGGDQRAGQRLRMGGGAGEDRHGLPRLEARQRQHALPRVDQLEIANRHVRLRSNQAAAAAGTSGAPRKSPKAA